MSNELIEHTDRPDLWALGLHLIELQKEVRVYSLEQTDLLIKQLALAML